MSDRRPGQASHSARAHAPGAGDTQDTQPLTRLFLCGDVMTGRGIDQILATPSDPRLFEPHVRSALQYVQLAEERSGPIARPVAAPYIWGAALEVLERFQPEARIINLETAITRSDQAAADKSIHYRMHPRNIGCLSAAHIDCCVLANNHVLDWGRDGLRETLRTLHATGIATAGAGEDYAAASAPARLERAAGGRLLVYGVALDSSGVPPGWQAGTARPGVNWLAGASAEGAERMARQIAGDRHAGERVIVSVHWGGNWGYQVTRKERAFAHALIEHAGVDLVHGHSSHHPKGLEIYRNKLILYGCGDFVNDYEGIAGYERFRPDLTLMYLATLDGRSGAVRTVTLVPLSRRRLRLERASAEDAEWLCEVLDRESCRWGTRVRAGEAGTLCLEC